MKNEKETALGAENTESGKANESDFSLSELEAKVKRSQAIGPVFSLREPTTARLILDIGTEMFILNELQHVLNCQYSVDSGVKYDIVATLISKCAEANGYAD